MEDLKHKDLWQAYWDSHDSNEAVVALVEAWIPLVHSILRKMSIAFPSHISLEDLFQSAFIGLYQAVERFDPKHGIRFETFASYRIRGAIRDELRNMDHMSRSGRDQMKKLEGITEQWIRENGSPPSEEDLAQSAAMDGKSVALMLESALPWLSLDQEIVQTGEGAKVYLRDVISDDTSPPPDKVVEREDVRRLFRHAFRKLSVREQKILYLYYFEELRLGEIALLFDLTEARICQIHGMVILKLKSLMNTLEYGSEKENAA